MSDWNTEVGTWRRTVRSWLGAMSTGDGFGPLWEETAPLKLRPYGTL